MEINSFNFNENEEKILCRLCLTMADKMDVIPIFASEASNSACSMDALIRDCIALEVSFDDGLPPNVCSKCANKVSEWYDFKISAHRADQRLRQMLARNNLQVEVEITNHCPDSNSATSTKTENDFCSDDFNDDEDDNIPLSRISVTRNKKTKSKRKSSTSGTKGRTPKAKPFCTTCNTKFLQFSEYFAHQKDVHGVTVDKDVTEAVDYSAFIIFRCHICKEEFENRSDLRFHCRNKHSVRVIQPYGCSHCDRQFPSWNLLVVHERQHTGEKPYSCDLCGKENFISFASLRRHKLMHSKVFSCKQCGRDFNCDSALKAHIRCKHTNEKPFLCNICGRSFSLATILNAHMTSHSTERKYKCEICGFRSKTSGNHHRHRARHNQGGAKTFHCETCGKAFETKLKLSSHQIIHRPVRPHVCKLCGKGFLFNNKLERHILLVHAKERPYSCHVCGKKLASKFGLGIHLKTHAKVEIIPENEILYQSAQNQLSGLDNNVIGIPKREDSSVHSSEQVQEISLLIH